MGQAGVLGHSPPGAFLARALAGAGASAVVSLTFPFPTSSSFSKKDQFLRGASLVLMCINCFHWLLSMAVFSLDLYWVYINFLIIPQIGRCPFTPQRKLLNKPLQFIFIPLIKAALSLIFQSIFIVRYTKSMEAMRITKPAIHSYIVTLNS